MFHVECQHYLYFVASLCICSNTSDLCVECYLPEWFETFQSKAGFPLSHNIPWTNYARIAGMYSKYYMFRECKSILV